jgi:hypothetical protein
MKWLVNFYNVNNYFHSFTNGMVFALVGFITTYSQGVPSSKAGWLALASGVGGALFKALTRWLQNNVATAGVLPKPSK